MIDYQHTNVTVYLVYFQKRLRKCDQDQVAAITLAFVTLVCSKSITFIQIFLKILKLLILI